MNNLFQLCAEFQAKAMSRKTSVVSSVDSRNTKSSALAKRPFLKFSLTVFGFLGLLVLSAFHNFLFMEWLGISMAIVLALFSIHIIGEQQTKRTNSKS